MRSLKFWKMQIQLLSLSERMFYKDVIDTLLAWKVLKEECLELIILKRMLESEIHVSGQSDLKEEKRPAGAESLLHCPAGNMSNFEKYFPGNKTY
jgi:hypothetical protein